MEIGMICHFYKLHFNVWFFYHFLSLLSGADSPHDYHYQYQLQEAACLTTQMLFN